jgi:hypothetical protein
MGREPDEVALQRGPDGLRPTSSRDCGHLILLAGIGAAGGDTAGREPEHWNRPGRAGPGRARHPDQTPTKEPTQNDPPLLELQDEVSHGETGRADPELWDSDGRMERAARTDGPGTTSIPGQAGPSGRQTSRTQTKEPAQFEPAKLEL